MDSKFDRRNRPQKEREIYTPGSGPLKRTDNAEGKNFTNRQNNQLKYKHFRDDKFDFNSPVNSFEPHESKSDQLNDEHYDKDRKKNRKPDVSLYIPKQRYREDSSHQNIDSSEHSSGYSSGFGSSNKLSEPRQMNKDRNISESNNFRQDDGQARNKPFIESKQFTRGSRTDLSQNWKDSSTKENSESRFERNLQSAPSGSNERSIIHQTEYKNSTFYNRFGNDRNSDRGASEKNRGGKNLMRRNSSNSLVLPDAFYSWPPRLRRQHLESKGIKGEELDKYLENRNDFGGNNSRDRFPHAPLPPKSRSSRFRSSKKETPKERADFNVPRNVEEKIDDVRPTPESNHEPEKNHESEANTGGSVEDLSDEVSKSCMVSQSTFSSCIIDTKSILDDSFNWAEEVEREQLNAERNNSEAEDRSRIDEICVNEDRKEKNKKRRRREFRRKRGFSYERKNPPRSRNPSETENHSRRKEDERYRSNDNNARHSESSNNDGYLAWRRNKNPSPSRTRLGIMTRNHRNEGTRNEGTRNFSSDQERISNKIKINNKMNELPSLVKDSAGDHVAGIIKIPQPTTSNQPDVKCSAPVFPEQHVSPFPNKPIKQLYNPTNPKQPILVSNQSARAAVGTAALPVGQHYAPAATSVPEHANYLPSYLDPSVTAIVAPSFLNDQYLMSKPAWYDAYSESFRSTHNAHLLLDISRADTELQTLLQPGAVVRAWDRITDLRTFLQDALRTLLTSDLKFCEAENVEQHMWKILFYNVIELLRKCIIEDAASTQKYKNLMFLVIDKGVEYFRSLLVLLERTYKIRIEDFLNVETTSTKQLGLSGLALISAQKIYLSLGDLARYRETTEESSTYCNSRHWYVKANQLNPRNGRPYNQLAILAVYARKKFDAVYYYMRSLMASNPFFTARDSLLALFDENRKKYELIEKNRRELKEQKKQEKAKEKESVINGSLLRKEIWIRPGDGQRIQRTTSTSQECQDDSDDDELQKLSAAEVNKRFLLSFLHVHGKLFSKVGMETLQEAAIEMLKEFKMLLNFTPLPINSNRLIQLLALNMFAIDNGQLKDPQIESGYHSAVQESALVISLQMFNLIISRCIQLLRDQLQQMKKHPDHIDWHYPLIVSADVQILLPAIKLWCDWLFCHSGVWNPPPSCQDYRISGCGDCWNRLAVFINLLEELDYQEVLRKNGQEESILIMEAKNGVSLVKITLDEDVALRGFTPLMCNAQQPVYTYKHVEMELAQICLRIHRVLFFGTIYLCGIDPPVLKLHKTESGLSEYVSVVEEVVTPKEQSDSENVYEQWSDNEAEHENNDDDPERSAKLAQMSEEEKGLLHRKKELERIHQKREKYMRDKKETIQKDIAAFSVEMEIKPHYLVPDTNCFIDYLSELEKIVKAISSTQRPLYSLMVPLIVLGELEGIARGHKDDRVTEKARFALNFLQNGCSFSNIKCVTTRGSVLPSTRFTSEEDYSKVEKNDDKILTTCLNLCKHNDSNDNSSSDQPKKIYREVVLMTEDRNLRVKALSSNMPVQTVADFIKWAGLH